MRVLTKKLKFVLFKREPEQVWKSILGEKIVTYSPAYARSSLFVDIGKQETFYLQSIKDDFLL